MECRRSADALAENSRDPDAKSDLLFVYTNKPEDWKVPEQDKRRRHLVAPNPLSAHGFCRHAETHQLSRRLYKSLIGRSFVQHARAPVRRAMTARASLTWTRGRSLRVRCFTSAAASNNDCGCRAPASRSSDAAERASTHGCTDRGQRASAAHQQWQADPDCCDVGASEKHAKETPVTSKSGRCPLYERMQEYPARPPLFRGGKWRWQTNAVT
jgi:hypothetical protein